MIGDVKTYINLVHRFTVYFQLFVFYLQPRNQKYLQSGAYEQNLWNAIFASFFKTEPLNLSDPRWDVLFNEYRALSINLHIRKGFPFKYNLSTQHADHSSSIIIKKAA